jgi:glycosyltransferase involved in cell wall biosynthesis
VQAQILGISDRVLFLGQRTDVPCLLPAGDIHCQANTGAEAFGIAFIEALYAGLPVITTPIGGAMEIVDDSCGRLVAANDNDIDALSEILGILISHPIERASLPSGGKARTEYLSHPERQLNRLYSLLFQVVNQNVIT